MWTVYLLCFLICLLNAQEGASRIAVRCTPKGNVSFETTSISYYGPLTTVLKGDKTDYYYLLATTNSDSSDNGFSMVKDGAWYVKVVKRTEPVHKLTVYPSHTTHVVNCTGHGSEARFNIPYVNREDYGKSLVISEQFLYTSEVMTEMEMNCFKGDVAKGVFMGSVGYTLSGACGSEASYNIEADCEMTISTFSGQISVIVNDKRNQGHFTLRTELTSLTKNCTKFPCRAIIEGKERLTGVCHNGRTTEYVILKDEALDCPLSGYTSLRAAALHVCKSSAFPVAFWVLLCVICGGHWVLLGFNWAMYYIYHLILRTYRAAMAKRTKWTAVGQVEDIENVYQEVTTRKDETIQICDSCHETFSTDDCTAVLHVKCSQNECPYCGKKLGHFTESAFRTHVRDCPNKKNTMEDALEASGAIMDNWRVVLRINTITSWSWGAVILVLIIICLSPTYAEVLNDDVIENVVYQNKTKAPKVIVVPKIEDIPEKPIVYEAESWSFTRVQTYSLFENLEMHCGTDECPIEKGICTCQMDAYSKTVSKHEPVHSINMKAHLYAGFQHTRVGGITWTDRDVIAEGHSLSGTFTGFIKPTGLDRMTFTGKAEGQTIEISVYLKDYQIHYELVPKAYVLNRQLWYINNFQCLAPCVSQKDHFGVVNTDPNAVVVEMNNINWLGMKKTGERGCWNPAGGCISCGLAVGVPQVTGVIAQFEVGDATVSGTICGDYNGKTVCEIFTDTGILKFGEDKITVNLIKLVRRGIEVSKGDLVYAHLNKAPGRNVWGFDMHPQVYKTDLIPRTLPAIHGNPGDTYITNLEALTAPVTSRYKIHVNYDTVSFNHHKQDRSPACTFIGHIDVLNKPFSNIMENTDGRSPRISTLTTTLVATDKGVTGKFSTKPADDEILLTGTVENIIIALQTPVLNGIQFGSSRCRGVVNTVKGFDCNVTIKSWIATAPMSITLISVTDGVFFTKTVVALPTRMEPFIQHVRGVSMLELTVITFCAEGTKWCGEAETILTKQLDFIVEDKASTVLADTGVTEKCEGWDWFSCAVKSTSNFFTGIWGIFKTAWWILVLLIIGIVILIIVRVCFYLKRVFATGKQDLIKKRVAEKMASYEGSEDITEEEILAEVLKTDVTKREIVKEKVKMAKAKMNENVKKTAQFANDFRKKMNLKLKKKSS